MRASRGSSFISRREHVRARRPGFCVAHAPDARIALENFATTSACVRAQADVANQPLIRNECAIVSNRVREHARRALVVEMKRLRYPGRVDESGRERVGHSWERPTRETSTTSNRHRCGRSRCAAHTRDRLEAPGIPTVLPERSRATRIAEPWARLSAAICADRIVHVPERSSRTGLTACMRDRNRSTALNPNIDAARCDGLPRSR